MKPASYWVEKYNLLPHPEGGYYSETYRSFERIEKTGLPDRFPADRSFSTGIYFLLEKNQFSAFHRIKSDEIWHFYAGESLDIFVINPQDGNLEIIKLGSDPEQGEIFQAVVPAGAWFGSRPSSGSNYSLVGCTVSPGFDFEDFEMAEREELAKQYAKHQKLIQELTRV